MSDSRSAFSSRLTLPPRPLLVAERTFLPSGDIMPSWKKLSLTQKLPMFPAPRGTLQLYREKLGKKLFANTKKMDFDLGDPNNYTISSTYSPLNDPHLQHVFKTPRMQRHLQKIGQLTKDKKVLCSLKDFNDYRIYLKRLAVLEFKHQQAEEAKRIQKAELEPDKLEITVIETRVHEQQVRSRQNKLEEELLEKRKMDLFKTERKLQISKRKKEFDSTLGDTTKKLQEKENHRKNVYRNHVLLVMQRANNRLKAWKRKMRKHLQRMKKVEDNRLDNLDNMLREKWLGRQARHFERELQIDREREAEEERSQREKRFLEAETNQRWMEQAEKLQRTKDRARAFHRDIEEMYSRNLARAFANSRLLNPGEEGQLQLHAARRKIKKTEEDKQIADRISSLKTVYTQSQPAKQSFWVLEESLEQLGVNIRFHDPKAKKSMQEMKKLRLILAQAARGRPTDRPLRKGQRQLTQKNKYLPLKKAAKTNYPTKAREVTEEDFMETDTPATDEIRLYQPVEECLQDMDGLPNLNVVFDPSTVREKVKMPTKISLVRISSGTLSDEPSAISLQVSATPSPYRIQDLGDSEMVETLLLKLLSDLNAGYFDKQSLVQLTSLCNKLYDQQQQLAVEQCESQATSTTTLTAREIVSFSIGRVKDDIVNGKIHPDALAATVAGLRASDSEISPSVCSNDIDRYVINTIEKACNTDYDPRFALSDTRADNINILVTDEARSSSTRLDSASAELYGSRFSVTRVDSGGFIQEERKISTTRVDSDTPVLKTAVSVISDYDDSADIAEKEHNLNSTASEPRAIVVEAESKLVEEERKLSSTAVKKSADVVEEERKLSSTAVKKSPDVVEEERKLSSTAIKKSADVVEEEHKLSSTAVKKSASLVEEERKLSSTAVKESASLVEEERKLSSTAIKKSASVVEEERKLSSTAYKESADAVEEERKLSSTAVKESADVVEEERKLSSTAVKKSASVVEEERKLSSTAVKESASLVEEERKLSSTAIKKSASVVEEERKLSSTAYKESADAVEEERKLSSTAVKESADVVEEERKLSSTAVKKSASVVEEERKLSSTAVKESADVVEEERKLSSTAIKKSADVVEEERKLSSTAVKESADVVEEERKLSSTAYKESADVVEEEERKLSSSAYKESADVVKEERKLSSTAVKESASIVEEERKLSSTAVKESASLVEEERKLSSTAIKKSASVVEEERKLSSTAVKESASLVEEERKLSSTAIKKSASVVEEERKLSSTAIKKSADVVEEEERKLSSSAYKESADVVEEEERKLSSSAYNESADVVKEERKLSSTAVKESASVVEEERKLSSTAVKESADVVEEERKLSSTAVKKSASVVEEERKLSSTAVKESASLVEEERKLSSTAIKKSASVVEEERKLSSTAVKESASVVEEEPKLSSTAIKKSADVIEEERKLSSTAYKESADVVEEERKLSSTAYKESADVVEEERKLSSTAIKERADVIEEERKLSSTAVKERADVIEEERKLSSTAYKESAGIVEEELKTSLTSADRLEDKSKVVPNIPSVDSEHKPEEENRAVVSVAETDRCSDDQEEAFNAWLVENTIRNTVEQLTADLESGSLSRLDVREIGSAVASAVLGNLGSDSSLLADEVLVPTLHHIMKMEYTFDERLLDEALAGMLASYNQVSHRRKLSVWEVLKEFVLNVLGRTLSKVSSDPYFQQMFVDEVRCVRDECDMKRMELPEKDEMAEVLVIAMRKFLYVTEYCCVLCDMMRPIVTLGQDILARYNSKEKLSIPRVNQSLIDQIETSPCVLEVTMEIAASVCEGLNKMMLDDKEFATLVTMTLGPHFMFLVLANWEELSDSVPKENTAIQTSKETRASSVRPTLAEHVLLIALYRMMRDVNEDRMSESEACHMVRDVKLFLEGRLVTINTKDGEETHKRTKLEPATREFYEQSVALLTVSVHASLEDLYVHRVIRPESSAGPDKLQININAFVGEAAYSVFQNIINQVARKLSTQEPSTMQISDVTLVMEVLKDMAEEAKAELKRILNCGLDGNVEDLSPLNQILHASLGVPKEREKMLAKIDSRALEEFLERLVQASDNQVQDIREDIYIDYEEKFNIVREQVRRLLKRLAYEMSKIYIKVLKPPSTTSPEDGLESADMVNKMVTFLISILKELRNSMTQGSCSLRVSFEFLSSVAPSLCIPSTKNSLEKQCTIVQNIIEDITRKKMRSVFYDRIVKTLSKMSLQDQDDGHVPEGMATIAEMLASADTMVLTTFIQTTLLSLLRTIHSDKMITGRKEEAEVKEETPPSDTITGNEVGDTDDEGTSKDIEQEARIIIHVALQNTLKRLGVVHTESGDIIEERDLIACCTLGEYEKPNVENLEPADNLSSSVPSQFTGLDESLAVYATHLVNDASKFVSQDAEEGLDGITTESMAGVILRNTLLSIQTRVNEGKMFDIMEDEILDEKTDRENREKMESISHRLSVHICTTLRAVRSELDLQHIAQQGYLDLPYVSTEDSAPKTFRKARKIVDYLIRRVENDVEAAKVEFQITSDNHVSVHSTSTDSSQQSVRKRENLWDSLSPSSISTHIVRTFADVLNDLHDQNKFFDPCHIPASNRRNSVVTPGLPYLLDEFILVVLQDIATHMQDFVKGRAGVGTLRSEAAPVARSFHNILKQMIFECKDQMPTQETPHDEGDIELQTLKKKMVVYTVLDKTMHETYIDSLDSSCENFQNSARWRSLHGTPDQGTPYTSQTQNAGIITAVIGESDLIRTLCAMEKILTNEHLHQPSKSDSCSETTPTSDTFSMVDIVFHATALTMKCIRKGQVSEENLKKLYRAFGSHVRESASREDCRQQLLMDLEVLLEDIKQGVIPPVRLQQAVQELSMMTIDPALLPNLRETLTVLGESSATSLSTLDLLKHAVAKLLSDISRTHSTTEGRTESRRPSITVEGNIMQNLPKGTRSSGQDDEDVEFPLVKRVSSLSRTVSKTNVRSGTENRVEESSTNIYSSMHVLQSPVSFHAEVLAPIPSDAADDSGHSMEFDGAWLGERPAYADLSDMPNSLENYDDVQSVHSMLDQPLREVFSDIEHKSETRLTKVSVTGAHPRLRKLTIGDGNEKTVSDTNVKTRKTSKDDPRVGIEVLVQGEIKKREVEMTTPESEVRETSRKCTEEREETEKDTDKRDAKVKTDDEIDNNKNREIEEELDNDEERVPDGEDDEDGQFAVEADSNEDRVDKVIGSDNEDRGEEVEEEPNEGKDDEETDLRKGTFSTRGKVEDDDGEGAERDNGENVVIDTKKDTDGNNSEHIRNSVLASEDVRTQDQMQETMQAVPSHYSTHSSGSKGSLEAANEDWNRSAITAPRTNASVHLDDIGSIERHTLNSPQLWTYTTPAVNPFDNLSPRISKLENKDTLELGNREENIDSVQFNQDKMNLKRTPKDAFCDSTLKDKARVSARRKSRKGRKRCNVSSVAQIYDRCDVTICQDETKTMTIPTTRGKYPSKSRSKPVRSGVVHSLERLHSELAASPNVTSTNMGPSNSLSVQHQVKDKGRVSLSLERRVTRLRESKMRKKASVLISSPYHVPSKHRVTNNLLAPVSGYTTITNLSLCERKLFDCGRSLFDRTLTHGRSQNHKDQNPTIEAFQPIQVPSLSKGLQNIQGPLKQRFGRLLLLPDRPQAPVVTRSGSNSKHTQEEQKQSSKCLKDSDLETSYQRSNYNVDGRSPLGVEQTFRSLVNSRVHPPKSLPDVARLLPIKRAKTTSVERLQGQSNKPLPMSETLPPSEGTKLLHRQKVKAFALESVRRQAPASVVIPTATRHSAQTSMRSLNTPGNTLEHDNPKGEDLNSGKTQHMLDMSLPFQGTKKPNSRHLPALSLAKPGSELAPHPPKIQRLQAPSVTRGRKIVLKDELSLSRTEQTDGSLLRTTHSSLSGLKPV